MHARWSLLPLVATLLAGACAPADAPTLPRADAAVRSVSSLAVLTGSPPASIAGAGEAVIGASGGTVSLSGHTLTVPAGAVAGPTRFSIAVSYGGHVAVELLALAPDADGAYTVDVGEAGFAVPVTLTLSYAYADTPGTPSTLRVVYLADGTATGRLVPLGTTVDATGQTVSASLEHFSGYAIATGG